MKVSIIITTFNSQGNLRVSLPSLLAQKGLGEEFEFEIIAIDNCSTDNTLKVLEEYGVRYYVNDKNTGGPNHGRNRGLELATGDAICFTDDDDEWHPEKTRKQLEALKRAPIVTTGYLTVNRSDGSALLRGATGPETTFFKRNATFLQKLTRSHQGQYSYMSSIMISKTLKHVHFEEHFGMLDFDWLLRLFENRESIQVNLPLVTRYVHNSNISLTPGFRKTDYYYALYTLENYAERYPKEVAQARKRLNGTRARYHYGMGQMRHARKYFAQSSPDLKNLLYYITTFAGSRWVRKNYHVFG